MSRTQMQVEARIQPHPASMLDEILGCPKSSEVLITLADSIVGATAVLAIGHQDGDLSA